MMLPMRFDWSLRKCWCKFFSFARNLCPRCSAWQAQEHALGSLQMRPHIARRGRSSRAGHMHARRMADACVHACEVQPWRSRGAPCASPGDVFAPPAVSRGAGPARPQETCEHVPWGRVCTRGSPPRGVPYVSPGDMFVSSQYLPWGLNSRPGLTSPGG